VLINVLAMLLQGFKVMLGLVFDEK